MEEVVSILLRGVLSTLSSPIQNEFGLLWGMEKEHLKLRSNLLTIEAVLQDAEARQVKEKAVRDWLRKLKEVAYDADDLVDEFMVEALRRKVEIRDGMLKKVHDFFSPMNPLVFRFKMAHKMQELRERLDEISEEKNDFHFNVGVLIDNQPPISRTRETHSYVDESEVYGRDDEKEKIIDSLIKSGEDEVLSVISIVGMGGVGKSTLAQLVYKDERVAAHFNLKMWVYVSDDFDVGKLVNKILESAINGRSDPLSLDLLQTRLREELSGKKYLLVLDDVWNEVHEKWGKLKTILKCGAQGSKIIVTTRSNTVASIMGTLPLTHHLGLLSENNSWSLFERLAHPDPKLVSIGKELVKKCGGLPLAIKTLGGLMSSKRSESEWLSVRDSDLWESQDTDEGILPSLRLSYNHLTPQLKQCFAYCEVFRKGTYFDKDKLIKQWVAQGFIQSGDENRLLEEKGEDFFNDLLSRSLFQVAKKDDEGNVIMIKMHDLIHDFLHFAVGMDTRHLSLTLDSKSGKGSKNMEGLVKACKNLRSMFLYSSIDFDFRPVSRSLKVLVLRGAISRYLSNALGKLKHLRYLDISYSDINELPETICNLHSLQTLILEGFCPEKLPKGIKRMTSLRHIVCVKQILAIPMPHGIGELTCLQTVPRFSISQEGGGIEELKYLNQLRGKLHIEGLVNIRNEKCAREAKLMEKQHLRSLTLSCFSCVFKTNTDSDTIIDFENVFENLEPHSNLKELSISLYLECQNFPSWIKKLTNLVKISLSGWYNCEHQPPLGQLPFLEALHIRYMTSMKYVFVIDGAYNEKDIFPSLKELKISHMRDLEGLWPHQVDNGERQEERHEQVLLGRLRSLKISHCPKLIQLPTPLFFPVLERLELFDVGYVRLEIPTTQSLKVVRLYDMGHLEELSVQQAHGLEELYVVNCPRMIHLPRQEERHEQVHLRCLRSLIISYCPKLIQLPMLLFFPALERLELSYLGCVRLEIHTTQSLKVVNLCGMEHLEELSVQQAHGLEELHVVNCPRMIHFPRHLPSLKRLLINRCGKMLLDPIDNYSSLEICYINWSSTGGNRAK